MEEKGKTVNNKIIIILLTIILMTGCSSDLTEDTLKDTKTTTYTGNRTTTLNQTKTTTNNRSYSKKTYKVTSDKYNNYIKNMINNVIITNDLYQLKTISFSYPYIRIYIDYFNPIEKDYFESKNKEIANNVFGKLKENNYKSGHIYEYQYNIISLEFYSQETNCKVGCAQNDFIQIDVLKIKNSSTLEEYLRK